VAYETVVLSVSRYSDHAHYVTRSSAIAERPRCRVTLVLAESGRLELGDNILLIL